jgi:uncharacterized protein YjbI with pentapeptide repeats
MNTTPENPLPTIAVPPAQLPVLELLWAQNAPLSPFDILEGVNAVRQINRQEELTENDLKQTLLKMRKAGLLNVHRPDKTGAYQVVPEKSLEDALKKRDGKTRYGTPIDVSQVIENRRGTRITDGSAQLLWKEHASYISALIKKRIFKSDRDLPKAAEEHDDFTEPYSLLDIYVKPMAYTIVEDEEANSEEEKNIEIRQVVNLFDTLYKWVFRPEKDVEYATLILSGDAGGGKSSFARYFAYKLLFPGDYEQELVPGEEPPDVLYVPLQNLPVSMAPRQALSHIAKQFGYPPDVLNPLGPTDRKTLLIFDGLDELAKQGDGAQRAAQLFAEGISKAVSECREKGRQLRVLLCGRPIAAQDAQRSFQNLQQTYHLLPFHLQEQKPNERKLKYRDFDPKKHDQRHEWWRNYATHFNACGPKNVETELPITLLDERLNAFTAQPLLLLLLAITYRDRDIKLNPADVGNQQLPPSPFEVVDGKVTVPKRIADLYAYLLARVYYRDMKRKGYDNAGHQSPSIDYCDFRDLLGALGIAAWHTGTARVATVEQVEQLCEPLGLTQTLKKYKEAYKADTMALFVAFYLSHANRLQDSQESFEFTVKPFAEYLAASGLASAISDIASRLGVPREGGRRGKPWTARELLLEWLQIAGPAELTRELYVMLCQEVKRRVQQGEEPELGRKGREVFTQLLEAVQPRMISNKEEAKTTPHLYLVDQDLNKLKYPVYVGSFPAEELKDLSHERRVVWCNQAEYALLHSLSACEQASPIEKGKYIDIRWPIDTSLAEMLRRIRRAPSDYFSWESPYPPLSLKKLSCDRQRLTGANLSGANLSGADLERANLERAELIEANLIKANLSGADLDWADLSGADLRKANLERAKLTEADLIKADLSEADLEWANLSGANLLWADLSEANLSGADLRKANLIQANLFGANFSKTKLSGTNLRGATDGEVKLDTPEGLEFLRSKGAIV